MRPQIVTILTFVLVFIINTPLLGMTALSGPGTGPPPPNRMPDPPPELSIPVDDNLYILIAMGLLYGIYVYYKRTVKVKKAV